MQPVLTQVPPNLSRSMTATFMPLAVRRPASEGPACPAPITIASKFWVMFQPSEIVKDRCAHISRCTSKYAEELILLPVTVSKKEAIASDGLLHGDVPHVSYSLQFLQFLVHASFFTSGRGSETKPSRFGILMAASDLASSVA